MHQKLIGSVAVLGVLAGCSNIGEINGVPVGQNATLSTQSDEDPYCEREPAVCILGAAVLIGFVGAAMSSSGGRAEPERIRPAGSRGATNVNIVQRSSGGGSNIVR